MRRTSGHQGRTDRGSRSSRSAFLKELRPQSQLSSHPAAALLWLGTVAMTFGFATLAIKGRMQWQFALTMAVVMWADVLLGAWCSVRLTHWERPPVEGDRPGAGEAEPHVSSLKGVRAGQNRFRAERRPPSHSRMRGDDGEVASTRFDSRCSLN